MEAMPSKAIERSATILFLAFSAWVDLPTKGIKVMSVLFMCVFVSQLCWKPTASKNLK